MGRPIPVLSPTTLFSPIKKGGLIYFEEFAQEVCSYPLSSAVKVLRSDEQRLTYSLIKASDLVFSEKLEQNHTACFKAVWQLLAFENYLFSEGIFLHG